ncbi:MAG: 50S ribosomal protein L5 [Parcubacteria group bacterium]|nr:50S ribosomal protein L5 [Parcubacteria group bacterium]
MNSLRERLKRDVWPAMQAKFNLANVWAVPRLWGVAVNAGLGRMAVQSGKPEDLVNRISLELAAITGQKPSPTKAKKAIAAFNTRQGMTLGLKVTLHGERMYDFLGRVINTALPRTRDFRGLAESCVDQEGNLNVGIKDHTVFPETSADAAHTFGLEFTVVVKGSNREKSLEFFKLMGFPFKR